MWVTPCDGEGRKQTAAVVVVLVFPADQLMEVQCAPHDSDRSPPQCGRQGVSVACAAIVTRRCLRARAR